MMSHASEGELHAYLDGALSSVDEGAAERLVAHLSRCVDCRTRLDQERAIRQRAGELLGAALPAVDTPPFESVVGAVPTRRWWASNERLGWAAAVVLALGAGWMGNALLRGSADSLMSPTNAVLQEADAGADLDRRLDVAQSETAEQELPADADPDLEGGAGTDPRVAGGEVAGPEVVGRQSAARSAANEPAEPQALELQSRDAAAPADEVRARENVAGEKVEDVVGAAQVGDTPEPAPPASAVVAGQREGAAEDSQLDDLAKFADGAVWRVVNEDEAAAWIGRAPLRVPDLDVVSFEATERAGAHVVRVNQALPGGSTLVLLQEPAGPLEEDIGDAERQRADETSPTAADANADAARAKRSEPTALVRNLVGGLWVTVTAPLAPDSLRALLSRVR